MSPPRNRHYYRASPKVWTFPLALLQLSRTAVCRWSHRLELADFHCRQDAVCPECPGGYVCERCGKRFYR